MRRIRKILSVILAIMMVLSIVPITVSAATYSGTCGNNLTWTYDEDTCVLTISGTGAMKDYDGVTAIRPWKDFANEIIMVVFEEGVTRIGNMSFAQCKALEQVVIPDTVTTVSFCAFLDCNSLVEITIPKSVTRFEAGAFDNNLENVYYEGTVSDWCNIYFTVDTANTFTSADNFYINGELVADTLIIPDDVTYIKQYVFSDCQSITDVVIGDGVETIDSHAFSNCDSLESVIMGDRVVTIHDQVFSGCAVLESVTIPNSVFEIHVSAFAYCENLTDVYYSGTQAEWEAINIYDYNKCLTDATIHFSDISDTLDPSVECDHNCHKGGISGFFWSIINFFNKLFGLSKTCECGVAHY